MAVVEQIAPCTPPYSFYFDLIEPYWRAEPAENMSLHRLTSLARKQGAQCVIIEDATRREDVAAEITDLDSHCGGGGSAEALAISFLSKCPPGDLIGDVDEDCLLGQCVLVNYRAPRQKDFTKTFILEAVFATPRLVSGTKSLLNNYINADGTFSVDVLGRIFSVTGICYNQQNGITSVCAHASIKMVLRTLFPQLPAISTAQINALIGRQASPEGMYPGEIANVMSQFDGIWVDRVSGENISPSEYISILTAAVESGDLALLVFKTGASGDLPAPAGSSRAESTPANHVVVVFGHTRNSDEWHPQAIPAYSGLQSASYCPSSSWVDHFVIHDDNFGPYFTLSSRALEVDPTVRAKTILIVRRRPCAVEAHSAEAWASTALSHVLPSLASIRTDPWFHLITGVPRTFVTRPVLVSRDEYLAHIQGVRAHDGSRAHAADAALMSALPELFWMVEFTLADLLTGNRSKLGEVLVDANWSEEIEGDRRNLIAAIRLPGLLLLKEASASEMTLHPFSIASHCEMYMRRPHDHQW